MASGYVLLIAWRRGRVLTRLPSPENLTRQILFGRSGKGSVPEKKGRVFFGTRAHRTHANGRSSHRSRRPGSVMKRESRRKNTEPLKESGILSCGDAGGLWDLACPERIPLSFLCSDWRLSCGFMPDPGPDFRRLGRIGRSTLPGFFIHTGPL